MISLDYKKIDIKKCIKQARDRERELEQSKEYEKAKLVRFYADGLKRALEIIEEWKVLFTD